MRVSRIKSSLSSQTLDTFSDIIDELWTLMHNNGLKLLITQFTQMEVSLYKEMLIYVIKTWQRYPLSFVKYPDTLTVITTN
jgi:hypothetical protein